MQHVVSTKTLIKSSIVAIVFAALVLFGIILPAEYNIDITGFGEKVGLTILSDTTKQESYSVPSDTIQQEPQVIEVTVPAGKGIEYKFYMQKFEKMAYEWLTDGESIYFDLHGEPQGDTTGYFESYTIATSNEMQGSFTAPFEGSHGWYWKNNGNDPIAIQLIVEGQYQVIGLIQ